MKLFAVNLHSNSTIMKKMFALAALVLAAKFSIAQPPAGPVKVGDTYGEKVKAKGAISTEDLTVQLAGKESMDTKVIGKVIDVCSEKGCWLKLQAPNQATVFVKMKDYAFFVPTELKGHTVVLDGNAKMKEVSVEEQKHYATDARKSQEEIAAITQPKKEVRFLASGIQVVD